MPISLDAMFGYVLKTTVSYMVQYIHVDVKNIDLQIKNTKSMFFIFIKKIIKHA